MNTRNSDNIIQEPTDSTNEEIGMRRNQEIHNPCYKEHLLALKCLDANQEDNTRCEIYFTNYKNCKKFWATVQSQRRSKGIKPYLPPLEERAKVKATFLNSR